MFDETERSAQYVADQDKVQRSIALSYVKAWQKLPPGPGDLLGAVLPVLAAREPSEDPEIRLIAEAVGDDDPDVHRAAWKELMKAAAAVHGSRVRHLWYRLDPETGKELRCFADLVWTKEVRVDSLRREVELVFCRRLIEYLPAILGPLGESATRPPSVNVKPATSGGLTAYCHERQP